MRIYGVERNFDFFVENFMGSGIEFEAKRRGKKIFLDIGKSN